MNSPPSQSPDPQTWRARLHEIIFEADTSAGKLFDVALLLAICLSVIAVGLETVETFDNRHHTLLRRAEWFFTILFTLEYFLRLVSVDQPRKYMLSLLGIIDLLSILPTYLSFMIGGAQSFAVLRSLRLLRVFRVFKLVHLLTEAASLRRAFWEARSKIVVFFSSVLIVVTIAGTMMYEIEGRQRRLPTPPELSFVPSEILTHEQSEPPEMPPGDSNASDISPSHFTSIPQSIYWAIVTMTTVGYGDIVPQTAPGKLVAAILILLGYSLIIVPTGFVSAELVNAKGAHTYTTQACPQCMAEGHDHDAIYCKKCGGPLKHPQAD